MEIVAPDILSDARQLSTILLVAAMLVGVLLWIAGWWCHRFWVVLGFTVLGGIWGLHNATALKSQPLLAAIGIGLAAGILALTLIRLGAFVAGGYAGLLLAHSAFPSFDQPLIAFLAGGFTGFFLFRYWVMALTSLAGVLLVAHAVLATADKLGKLDSVQWSETNAKLLLTICGLTALGGFILQLLLHWLWPAGESGGDSKESKKPKSEGGGVIAATLGIFRRAG